jgi:transcriptional regulator of acetoin/glycerol metabolism
MSGTRKPRRIKRTVPTKPAPPRPTAAVTAEAKKNRPPRPVVVAAGYPESWRSRLDDSRRRELRERDRQELLVAQAVAAGATFTEVAKALGISRQAAHKRFARVVGVVEASS